MLGQDLFSAARLSATHQAAQSWPVVVPNARSGQTIEHIDGLSPTRPAARRCIAQCQAFAVLGWAVGQAIDPTRQDLLVGKLPGWSCAGRYGVECVDDIIDTADSQLPARVLSKLIKALHRASLAIPRITARVLAVFGTASTSGSAGAAGQRAASQRDRVNAGP